MKTLSALILFGFLLCASAVPINIKDGNKTCIFGKTDLSITIMYNATNSSTMASVTVGLAQATDPVVNGTCGNSSTPALLNAYFKVNKQQWKASWSFSLNKNATSLTYLSLDYVLDSTTFPNISTPGKNMSASINPGVVLADSGKFFKCLSGVQLNVSDQVSFMQKDFEIEPFVVNGTPSKAMLECAGDKALTTEAPTTVTTEAPTTVTTEAPTGPTTAIPTIPPTPRPPIAKYEVRKNDKTCLLADLGIVFTLFENKTTVYEVANATVDQTNSMCAMNASTTAKLVLKFDTDSNLTMTFKNTNGQAVLDTMTLWYNANRGKNTTEKDMRMETGQLGLMLSSDNKFFTCNASLPERLTKTAVVQLVDSKIQVYNVNGNFSKDSEECMQDEPLPSAPSAGNYTVRGKDKVCILARMAVRFYIPYKNKAEKTVNLTVDLPTTDVAQTGVCGNKTQEMMFTFFKNWKFQMKFNQDKDKKVALTNATIMYSYNDLFLDAPLQQIGSNYTSVNNTLDAFGVKQGQVYKCVSANSTLKLGDVVVDVTDLYIESFRKTNDTNYSTTVIECNADNKTSTIVPIAVGAALAGLVVIVLIAYLIGRRRSHKGYQSV